VNRKLDDAGREAIRIEYDIGVTVAELAEA
jgi:hypothetical protein